MPRPRTAAALALLVGLAAAWPCPADTFRPVLLDGDPAPGGGVIRPAFGVVRYVTAESSAAPQAVVPVMVVALAGETGGEAALLRGWSGSWANVARDPAVATYQLVDAEATGHALAIGHLRAGPQDPFQPVVKQLLLSGPGVGDGLGAVVIGQDLIAPGTTAGPAGHWVDAALLDLAPNGHVAFEAQGTSYAIWRYSPGAGLERIVQSQDVYAGFPIHRPAGFPSVVADASGGLLLQAWQLRPDGSGGTAQTRVLVRHPAGGGPQVLFTAGSVVPGTDVTPGEFASLQLNESGHHAEVSYQPVPSTLGKRAVTFGQGNAFAAWLAAGNSVGGATVAPSGVSGRVTLASKAGVATVWANGVGMVRLRDGAPAEKLFTVPTPVPGAADGATINSVKEMFLSPRGAIAVALCTYQGGAGPATGYAVLVHDGAALRTLARSGQSVAVGAGRTVTLGDLNVGGVTDDGRVLLLTRTGPTPSAAASVLEAALDLPCAADTDRSGAPDLLDIFTFLQRWFGGHPRADFDQDRAVTILDIFAFLNAWFAGC